ncbi:nitronate monooxygenase [Parasphingorhabdus litoris]|uniref:Nitronate monooxygenase n=1 Tax=Parasphingorhabdus litoris TaxID=394733 RepID=A0ABN1AK23_9SPHN|nr:nitronate monooxygenase [Parasphingorhabdus litoris]
MTRFADYFDLKIPLALAPMALASGGALASACARAGTLGLVGGGYGDLEWTSREYEIAVDALKDDAAAMRRLGCGFISWKLAENSDALDWLIDNHRPAAVMLSFGDPRPFSERILQAGATLICQIHSLTDLPVAIEAGAKIIVAQGTEAGGHGATQDRGRGTISFISETADWLAVHAPETLLLGAGGIADGRGLAAAMVLGADGAMMGSRFWATSECLANPKAKDIAIETDGDNTARSSVFDVLRRKNWPESFDFRAIRNDLYQQWEDRIDLLKDNPEEGRAAYDEGVRQADFNRAHIGIGESVGMISRVPDAASLIGDIESEMKNTLKRLNP